MLMLKRGKGRPRIRPLSTTITTEVDGVLKTTKFKRASGNWSPKVGTDKEKLIAEMLSLKTQEKTVISVKMNLHKILKKLEVEELQLK